MKARQLFSHLKTNNPSNSSARKLNNKNILQPQNFSKTIYKSLYCNSTNVINTHNFTTTAFSSLHPKFSLSTQLSERNFSKSYFSVSHRSKIYNDIFLESEQQEECVEQLSVKYELGIRYYNNGNYEQAAEIFRDFLKPYLGNRANRKFTHEETALQSNKILDAMYHLGKIYLHLPEVNNYTKSAGIFQYCAAFGDRSYFKEGEEQEYYYRDHIDNWEVKQKKFIQAAHAVEVEFIKTLTADQVEITEHTLNECEKQISKYKKQLVDIRQHIAKELGSIEYLTLDQIQEKTEEVRKIYKQSSEFFINHATNKGLLQQIINDSEQILPTKPNGLEYSFIGLGSLSLGTITPWSDIEFAILINEDREDYKEYCRNLTKLIYIKLVNLGETPINRLGIHYLNNYTTVEDGDDWFVDDVMISGIGPDNAVWYGCKNPLGRMGYKAKINVDYINFDKMDLYNSVDKKKLKQVKYDVQNEQKPLGIDELDALFLLKNPLLESVDIKPNYELTLTPMKLAELQKEENIQGQKESWFDTDPHLVQALRSTCLISGNNDLLTKYREQIIDNSPIGLTKKILQERVLKILYEDINKFQLKLGDEEEGKLVNVKKDMYRLTDRIIDGLANYYYIKSKDGEVFDVWQIIDEMENQQILNHLGAKHIKQALSIATELRLKTYISNNGQHETMSTYKPAIDFSNIEQTQRLVHETFYTKDTSILHHFYYVMLPLQNIIKKFCNKEQHDTTKLILNNSTLYDDSNYNKGMVSARFLEYNKAIEFMEIAQFKYPKNIDIFNNLWLLYYKTGKVDAALNIISLTKKYDLKLPDVDFYIKKGNIYYAKYNYELAQKNYTKAYNIHIKSSTNINDGIIAVTTWILNLAKISTNLANCYKKFNEYNKAIEFYQNSLKIHYSTYNPYISPASIALIYNNIGCTYLELKNCNLAFDYLDKALTMRKKFYENKTPNNPEIALNYFNIGLIYKEKNAFEEALSIFDLALQIHLVCNNLSEISHCYQEKILCLLKIDNSDTKLLSVVNEQKSNLDKIKNNNTHVDFHFFTKNYHTLGQAFHKLDNLEQSIEYYEKCLNYNKDINILNRENLIDIYYKIALASHILEIFDKSEYYNKLLIELSEHSDDNYNYMIGIYNIALNYYAKEQFKQGLELILKEKIQKLALDNTLKTPNGADILHYHSTIQSLFIIQIANDRFLNNSSQAMELYTSAAYLIPNTFSQDELKSIDTDTIIRLINISNEQPENTTNILIKNSRVLLKLDPELKHENHYFKLANLYNSSNQIINANNAFQKAINHNEKNNISNSELCIEYAQFLIVNKDKISKDINIDFNKTISEYLYKSLSYNHSYLQYSQKEKNNIIKVLKDLIEKNNDIVKILTHALSYYLLITNPKYLKKSDTSQNMFKNFVEKYNNYKDNTTYKILINDIRKNCNYIEIKNNAPEQIFNVDEDGTVSASELSGENEDPSN